MLDLGLGLFLAFGAAAQPNPPDGFYLQDLRTWLKGNWYDGYHDQLGYNEGRRQMYGYTDILGNGNVECIYTGFQQPGGYVTYPNPINAEHIVPQSFFGSSEPMRSDIYILRPCHGNANSSRSNDPFGEVNDNQAQWYGVNGNNYTSTGNQPANSDNWSEGSSGFGSLENPRRETWPGPCSTTTPCTPTKAPTSPHAGTLNPVRLARERSPRCRGNQPKHQNQSSPRQQKSVRRESRPGVFGVAVRRHVAQRRHHGSGFHWNRIQRECGMRHDARTTLASPTDDCGIASLTYEDTFNGSNGCTGGAGILRTYTAVDECGNTSTFVQQLVFVDVEPPVFDLVPSDLTIACEDGDIPPRRCHGH